MKNGPPPNRKGVIHGGFGGSSVARKKCKLHPWLRILSTPRTHKPACATVVLTGKSSSHCRGGGRGGRSRSGRDRCRRCERKVRTGGSIGGQVREATGNGRRTTVRSSAGRRNAARYRTRLGTVRDPRRYVHVRERALEGGGIGHPLVQCLLEPTNVQRFRGHPNQCHDLQELFLARITQLLDVISPWGSENDGSNSIKCRTLEGTILWRLESSSAYPSRAVCHSSWASLLSAAPGTAEVRLRSRGSTWQPLQKQKRKRNDMQNNSLFSAQNIMKNL